MKEQAEEAKGGKRGALDALTTGASHLPILEPISTEGEPNHRLNGNDPGSRGGSEPVNALATLYDAHGSPIAQKLALVLGSPAGRFRTSIKLNSKNPVLHIGLFLLLISKQ